MIINKRPQTTECRYKVTFADPKFVLEQETGWIVTQMRKKMMIPSLQFTANF